jgi:hypothetical protein
LRHALVKRASVSAGSLFPLGVICFPVLLWLAKLLIN